jgi:hypothetical protein
MQSIFRASVAILLALLLQPVLSAEGLIESALTRAKDNRGEIERALKDVPKAQAEGMQFLVSHMPERDLQKLSAKYLLNNVKFAYQAWNESPWKDQIPKEVFFNDVLPYASINERRDDWREDFLKRFKPLIKDAKTPGEAAALLNQRVFPTLKVRYSTKRRKADQSPYESIESGLASCSGLTVLLIDACRSQGIPARFVGTPLWSDNSGNHSWVEVWDDGWHFTGAAEPTGNNLDRAWFLGRASKANRDSYLNSIYATSWKKTPINFPLVWDPRIDYIRAVNVTDRYTNRDAKIPEGHVRVMFRVLYAKGQRLNARIKVLDDEGKSVFAAKTNDERFDANDHITKALPKGKEFQLQIGAGPQTIKFKVEKEDQLISFQLSS